MEPGIDELRKTYEEFDNEELRRFIMKNANDLRPEALELLKKIVNERGLASEVFILAEEKNQSKIETEVTQDAEIAVERKNAARTGKKVCFGL